ncbi:MAG: Ger(x)C family spore germination protein [Bacilli bacterium]
MARFRFHRRKFTLILLALTLSLSLTGCWNNIELNSLRMADAIGIDLNKDGRYLVTVRMFKPSGAQGQQSGGASSGQQGGKQAAVLQASGYTLFDALRNVISVSGFKLYYEHLLYIALGRDLAEQDIAQVLDFMIRDHEERGRAWVLVADGRAESVLKTESSTHPNQTVMIDEMLKSVRSNGKYAAVQVIELMRFLSGADETAYLPRIRVTSEKDNLHIHGAVMIKRGKMIADLNDSETRGLLWLRDKITSTIVVVPLRQQRQYAAIEVIRSKTDIQSIYDGKQLRFKVKVRPIGNIGELSSYALTPSSYKALEKKFDKAISREILAAIKKARAHQVDVFGFYDYAHRRYPRKWRVWQDHWPEVFAQAPIRIQVDGRLLHSGQMKEQVE